MFRPYNLTSLAAWTFGSLAGNKAYYQAKACSQKITLKKSKRTSHTSFQHINPEVEAICAEANSLTDRLRSHEFDCEGKMEIMPLVHLIAYNEWFQKRKKSIAHDAESTENVRTISDHLNYVTNEMLKILNKYLKQEEQQQLLELIKNRITSCQIDESSFKLTDSDSGRFFIEGKKS